MKRIFISLITACSIALSVLGQGSFTFQANVANGLIQYSTDGATTALYPTAGLSGWGTGHIGFYAAPNNTVLTLGANGLPDFTGWTAVSNSVSISTGNGKTVAVNAYYPTAAPDSSSEVEVVGWTGTATSWSTAVASGSGGVGFSGEIFNGTQIGALGWSQPTVNPFDVGPPPLPSVVTGAGGFEGLVIGEMPPAIPEPGTMALGGLGAAILVARCIYGRGTNQTQA